MDVSYLVLSLKKNQIKLVFAHELEKVYPPWRKEIQLQGMIQQAQSCWGEIQKPPSKKLTFQVCIWEPNYKGHVWDTCSETRFPSASGVRHKVVFSAELLVHVNMSPSAVNQTGSNWRAEAVTPSWVCLHFLPQHPMLNWHLNVWIFISVLICT